MSHHNKHGHGQSQSQPGQLESPKALAYQLWEQAGCPEDQAERFWIEAEEQIKRLSQPPAQGSYHGSVSEHAGDRAALVLVAGGEGHR